MLNKQPLLQTRQPARHAHGMVLIVALVVLVVLALAAVGLLRGTFTSNLIAGNLAFREAAVHSADPAVEAAVVWLENNTGQSTSTTATTCTSGSTVLACDQTSRGYAATRTDPSSSQTWATLWTTLSSTVTPVALSQDSAGNTPSYLVQRMCANTGDATSASCSIVPSSTECGSSKTLDSNSGNGNIACTSQVYYRITVRVSWPRNTVSYTQVMVAL